MKRECKKRNRKSRFIRYVYTYMIEATVILAGIAILFGAFVLPQFRNQSEQQAVQIAQANITLFGDTMKAIRTLKESLVSDADIFSSTWSPDALQMQKTVKTLNVYRNAMQDVIHLQYYPNEDQDENRYYFSNEGTGYYTDRIRAKIRQLRGWNGGLRWSGELVYDEDDKELQLVFLAPGGGLFRCVFSSSRFLQTLLKGMPNGSSVAIFDLENGQCVISSDSRKPTNELPGSFGLEQSEADVRIYLPAETEPYALMFSYSDQNVYAVVHRVYLGTVVTTILLASVSVLLAIVFAYLEYKPIRRIRTQLLQSAEGDMDELEEIQRAIEWKAAAEMLRQMLFQAPEKVEKEENQLSHLLMQPLKELGIAVLLIKTDMDHHADILDRLPGEGMASPIVPVGWISAEIYACVCFFDSERSLLDTAHGVRMICMRETGDCPSLGVSRTQQGLLQLRRVFTEAQIAVNACEEGEILFFDELDIAQNTRPYAVETGMAEKKLLGYVKKGDGDKAITTCQEIIDQIFSSGREKRFIRFHCYGFMSRVFVGLTDMRVPCPYDQIDELETQYGISPEQVMAILGPVLRVAASQAKTESMGAIAFQVNQYIAEHFLDDQLSLARISEALNISVSTLEKQYKLQTGGTIGRMVSIKRMEWFKKQLRETELSVSELVKKCGEANVSSFIRKFREQEGITPSVYRYQMRQVSNADGQEE